MAARNQWPVKSFDVKLAFLHSPIDYDVLVKPPDGLDIPPSHVLRLKKALYGTKQAGRCWWIYLRDKLATIGFAPNPEDQSTYTLWRGYELAFLWIHIDDGILTASSTSILSRIQEDLSNALDLKWDAELASIIGIRVRETDGGFLLDQPMLIDKLLLTESSSVKTRTPITSSDLVSNPATKMDKEYLSRIGTLLYLSQGSRPDINFAVNFLARFSMNPDASHWAALHHLISYIRYSSRLALPIIPDTGGSIADCVTTYVDANRGGKAGCSVHGFFTLAWGSPVSWSSKRQSCIARSTCQAEYMALSFGVKDGQWITSLVQQLLTVDTPKFLSDNRSAIAISFDCATRKNH